MELSFPFIPTMLFITVFRQIFNTAAINMINSYTIRKKQADFLLLFRNEYWMKLWVGVTFISMCPYAGGRWILDCGHGNADDVYCKGFNPLRHLPPKSPHLNGG